MQNKQQKQQPASFYRRSNTVGDFGVAGAFISAIVVLILVGVYVVSRVSGSRAYYEKWKDYSDCGWA